MDKPQLLRMMEELLDLEPNSLSGSERLQNLKAWDSICTLRFIAMVDKEFGQPLRASRVVRCQTVDELVSLINCERLAA